jgi:hypothetical protein
MRRSHPLAIMCKTVGILQSVRKVVGKIKFVTLFVVIEKHLLYIKLISNVGLHRQT